MANFCTILKERGHEPVVFLPGEGRSRITVDGVPVIQVPQPHPERLLPVWRCKPFLDIVAQVLCARRLAKAFCAEHRSRPFDIIQASSYQSPGNALLQRTSIPVVTFLPGFEPVFRAALGLTTSFADHLADWLEIRQMLRADALFAPSRFLAESISAYLNVEIPVLRTPYHAREEQEDPSLYESELASKRYMLFFGKMDPRKGIEDLAGAAPVVFSTFPDVYLVIVGMDWWNRKTLRPYAEWILDAVGDQWRDKVMILGVEPRKRLMPIIRNARIVVLPSRVDNYPNTFVEARAVGKIVVSARNSSLDERIVDGETGFLAEPACPPSLAATICRALALSDSDRAAMEDRVRTVAEVENGEDIEKLIRFHQDVIEGFEGRTAVDRRRRT